MRRFFFLPPFFSYFLIFLIPYSFWKFHLIIEIPLLLLSSLILFIFRRSRVPYRDTLKNDGEIYLSPTFGVVKSIRQNVAMIDYPYPCHEIRVAVSFWDQKGLYLPTSGEVSYLKASRGRRLHRDSPTESFYGPIEDVSHTDLVLTSKNKVQTLMRFIDCSTGKRPTIWLKSGDRGRGAACFGYYPFGGTLLIYVPDTSDVLVYENEKVIPGLTVISALKNTNKG